MNMNTAQERIETAVRNIMSGNNACGTLAAAASSNNADYFRQMITPAIQVYEQEAEVLRQQRDAALKDAELKRFALECVLSNLQIPAGPVKEAMAAAMPGHPFLK